MARKKAPTCITAAKVAAWFSDDGRLHIELADHDDNPIAEIHLDFEDGAEILGDLAGDLGFILVDPDDVTVEGDTIGPTMGNA